jgi:hypothetical protein
MVYVLPLLSITSWMLIGPPLRGWRVEVTVRQGRGSTWRGPSLLCIQVPVGRREEESFQKEATGGLANYLAG